MKKILCLLLAALMALAMMTAFAESVELDESNPVVISMCGAITGSYSDYGLGYQAATKVQVDKWNAAGGINGRKIIVKEYDEKGEIEEGVAIAQKVVVDDSNYGMVGHFWSIMEAGEIYQEYGVPMIGPAASTMGFTDIGDYIFRNNPTIKTEPASMLDCAKAAGLTKLGVYYLATDWGEGSYEQLRALVDERPDDGFELVLAEEVLPETVDHAAAIAKFAEADVDAILMFCFYDSVAPFAIQASGKLDDTVIVCGVNCYNDEFIELGKADVEGCMAPMLSVKSEDDPDMAYFVEQYKALRDGKAPSSLDMQCYDSVGMMLTAIQNIDGVNDHAAIRDQLATMTYEGVCGTIQFDENRDATKEYIPLVVKDGAWAVYEG